MQMGSQITGKQVVSINNGADLGKVRNLYFDERIEQLMALELGGGFFGLNTRVVQLSDVVVLGEDMVLINHVDHVQNKGKVEALSNWTSISDLRKRKMRTMNNIPVGNVDDLSIDQNGKVLDFMLVWTQIKGPIAEKNRVSRRAVTDVGHESRIILIDLTIAERLAVV